VFLLLASYYFYMAWQPAYALLILFTTAVSYGTALLMAREKRQEHRRWYLLGALVVCLGILGIFKYFNFFSTSLQSVSAFLGVSWDSPFLHLLLPIGVSFYTFQTLSYVIDVYRGVQVPERHFGIYALYVSFFPQLVAGPIERPGNLLPQFRERFSFEPGRVTDGLKLMLWGFFKKVVIADNLAVAVDTVYGDPTRFTGLPLIVATVFFAFQIYCDFSGYSDIAIGSAQVMGFKLVDNFNRPYAARSIADFWRRWHISLSSWFRDYVYIPLGGNRVPPLRHGLNVLIVFLLSGLWHGAAWTFVVWGGLHGVYLVVGNLTHSLRAQTASALGLTRFPHILALWQIACTFLLVSVSWVFFRAASFGDALYILSHFTTDLWAQLTHFSLLKEVLGNLSMSKTLFIGALLSIIFLEEMHRLQRHEGMRHMFRRQPVWLRWSVFYFLLFAVLFAGRWGSQFIYFQF